MTDSTGSSRVVYLARPNRPVLVTESLEELTGPEHGIVELPQRLMWNPNRRFDLDDPDLVRAEKYVRAGHGPASLSARTPSSSSSVTTR